MKGSHINIWLTKGAKVKLDDSQSSTGSAGWENPAFGPRDSTELGSLGLVPLEEKVDELLERHQISFLVRSQASPGPGTYRAWKPLALRQNASAQDGQRPARRVCVDPRAHSQKAN